MQGYNFHSGEYLFFLIFLCTSTTSLAFISPLYFRTKPNMSTMAISALKQRSPVRELPEMESGKTSRNISKELPLSKMDTIPDSLAKYFGHMPTAESGIRNAGNSQNLLTQKRQQSLEKQAEKTEFGKIEQNTKVEPTTVKPSRRRYDYNCFFTPINCRPWIEPSRRTKFGRLNNKYI